ncbi:MAG: hypothetical protein JXM69_05180 [Anaerolineae bacterium]|nr:hypothetical protein [Anaerolineae bacterium]
MNFREIIADDIPDLFAVQVATHENRLSRPELTALGITEESVTEKLKGTFKGWLRETQGQVIGFAMGDKSTGEL